MIDAPLIEIRGLSKVFGNRPESVLSRVEAGESKTKVLSETGHTIGLRDINLEIQKGETFVIMGLSGSGKSTLIRHFNRLIDPTQGQILIDGSDIMQLSIQDLELFRRHKMSMVFQRFGLLPHRNIIGNIAFGLELQGLSKPERYQKAGKWLDTVGLRGYEEHFPSQLSGGQQQRVGLARALATDAEILLMDEAFSALDPLIKTEMQDQLIELQRTLQKTIVFITHDLDEALRIGDRIAILKDGELSQVGTPAEILLNPADEYVEAFVKNVNRARALNVGSVMRPPALHFQGDTIDDARNAIKRLNTSYAYHVTDKGYQGVLTAENIERFSAEEAAQPIHSSHYEPVPVLSPDQALEEVLIETILSHVELPVIGEKGHLVGELERDTVVELFQNSQQKMSP